MKLKYLYISAVLGLSLSMTSCDDFLDKETDNRVELISTSQIAQLLTTGYFTGNYGPICELSSDNMIDNNAPHYAMDDSKREKLVYYNLTSYNRMYDELFAFEPVSENTTDSPSRVWEGCYNAIATANHALEAIYKLREEGKTDSKMDGIEGEALLIRAYHHFLLVNIFSPAYRNPELSKNDVGIPYMTQPETKVSVEYDRGNVADVYKKIQEDLETGLPLINNEIYKEGGSRKFHFNEKAAHAFAARFYLFIRDYEKVITHANFVLGESAESALSCLPDWYQFKDCVRFSDYTTKWANPDEPNNLLLVNTYSSATRGITGGARYACNGDAAVATLCSQTPTCNVYPHLSLGNNGSIFLNGKQDWGVWSSKVNEFFEYTDKVAGIGYVRLVRREFTCAETLLCRIEAKLLKQNPDIEGALADMRAYDKNRQTLPTPGAENYFKDSKGNTLTLTKEVIEAWYTKENTQNPFAVLDYNTTNMSPDFVISDAVAVYFHCAMDLRRFETVGDGLRFFDLKRFGIEYSHSIGKSGEVRTLTWNDPRRAIEIPQEVISAGLEPSRPILDSSITTAKYEFKKKSTDK